MKFNNQLKRELRKYEQHAKDSGSNRVDQRHQVDTQKRQPRPQRCVQVPASIPEKVAGGDVKWKPVDKAASMMLARAPWWAHAPHVAPQPVEISGKNKQKTQRKYMVRHASEVSETQDSKWIVFGDYALEVKSVCKKSGQPLLDPVDMWPIFLEQMGKMKHELSPAALAMIDGENALRSATMAARECMDETKAASKVFLDEVRQTKYATLAEVSALAAPLKDLREFFLGKDYDKQIQRLKEFAELCERLQKLKDSGFLDSVADTMLRLADSDK